LRFSFAFSPLLPKRFFNSSAEILVDKFLKDQYFRARGTLKIEYRENLDYLFSQLRGKREYNKDFKYAQKSFQSEKITGKQLVITNCWSVRSCYFDAIELLR
jgi:hypothetical protein